MSDERRAEDLHVPMSGADWAKLGKFADETSRTPELMGQWLIRMGLEVMEAEDREIFVPEPEVEEPVVFRVKRRQADGV